MKCDWELESYYERGSEYMDVWMCSVCKKVMWLWESDGKPSYKDCERQV